MEQLQWLILEIQLYKVDDLNKFNRKSLPRPDFDGFVLRRGKKEGAWDFTVNSMKWIFWSVCGNSCFSGSVFGMRLCPDFRSVLGNPLAFVVEQY